jgi:hypothetical protein
MGDARAARLMETNGRRLLAGDLASPMERLTGSGTRKTRGEVEFVRIGIDFDNTIADYDAVFVHAARKRGWVGADFEGPKKLLRDTVRKLENGEIKWQILQGEVYGPQMHRAVPFAGVMAFFEEASRRGFDVFVVSHKTQFANHAEERVDLREAALAWMEAKGFFERKRTGLSPQKVFFADNRAEKIRRIKSLGCEIFVDDLQEVFTDASFPDDVGQILFTAADHEVTRRGIVAKATWIDITRHILNREIAKRPEERIIAEAFRAASALAGVPIRSVEPVRAGGNNRLFRVAVDDGTRFALKHYPRLLSDPRDRLKTEFTASQFMHEGGLTRVPTPKACDAATDFALYEWVDGTVPAASESTIDAAVTFVRELQRLSGLAGASALPDASEACFSPSTVVAQVERRRDVLLSAAESHPELGAFLSDDFAGTFSRAVIDARDLSRRTGVDFEQPLRASARCLSPSDFGFHNAIQRPDGQIVFLDFEYFGWDDPVKLTCDFMLHPGMNLPADLAQRFRRAMVRLFAAQPDFDARLRVSFPLYALRWTMILLNEFVPERWARRVAAGGEVEQRIALAGQLRKARIMLLAAAVPQR